MIAFLLAAAFVLFIITAPAQLFGFVVGHLVTRYTRRVRDPTTKPPDNLS